MPILLWFFSASFIGGIARALIAGIGIGSLTYVGTEYILSSLTQSLHNGVLGWNSTFAALLYISGSYEGFATVLSALSTAMTIKTVKAFTPL
jgi:hypothetical protein